MGITQLRYEMMSYLIKYITPSLYYKMRQLNLLGEYMNERLFRINSEIPRPSIRRMKKHFNNKRIRGAEIGVQKGNNSKSILKELNIEELFLIDIWGNYKGIDEFNINSEKYYQYVFNLFKNDKRVRIIRDFSVNAIKRFENESLDFVYIDGNHKYKYVYEDINLWYKKVRQEGFIAGHDIFNRNNVLDAVRDYCSKYKIRFFITPPDWWFIKK